jgi:hypothetical protein
MEKEFVPYELALELKQLGFNEPCFGFYNGSKNKNIGLIWYEMPNSGQDSIAIGDVLAPLYQQVFRWFREKHGLCIVIKPIDDKNLELGYNLLKNGLMMGSYLTYEEAELACLIKLTELAEARI